MYRLEISGDKFFFTEDGRKGEPPAKKRKLRAEDGDLEILGLEILPDNEDVILKAFRRAALLHHPDKTGGPGNFLKLAAAKRNLLARLKK